MYHKDSHKLRGIKPSLALDVVRTSSFRLRGCTDATAHKVVEKMKVSRKNEIRSRGSSTGRAQLGTPENPGTMWLSIFKGEHPAMVAALFLHEMIHSALGLRHGSEFDIVLSRAAEDLWGVRIPRSGWSHVYESDHALEKALVRSGQFDGLVPYQTIDPRCREVKERFYKKERATERYDFSHGDRVQFEHKGKTWYGNVTRINKKRFSVKVDGFPRAWLIPGRYLTRVK